MHLDYVDLPSGLHRFDLPRKTAVVFDVIRATTTMVTALANGAAEIRAFAELDQARAAYATFDGVKLLAGELRAVRPDDFHLGNAPTEFTRGRVGGAMIFMATTNGTRAVRACASAQRTFVATLANATAMARRLAANEADVVFVGSGVDGEPGGEDLDGVATVADAVLRLRPKASASAELHKLIRTSSWLSNVFDGVARLRASPGGRNLIGVKLDADIAFIAQLDRFDLVAEVIPGEAYARVRLENACT